MTNNEVREWIQFACDCNGCSELAGTVQLCWSNRMTSSMGIAAYNARKDEFTIKLSGPLFARATDEQKRQTVIHEACHIIEAYLGRYDGWDGRVRYAKMTHGPGWAKCMRAADCDAERYHQVNNAGLTKRYEYECPNGCHTFRLTARKHKESQMGRYRLCCKCKSRISWNGKLA
jgi:SprT protein